MIHATAVAMLVSCCQVHSRSRQHSEKKEKEAAEIAPDFVFIVPTRIPVSCLGNTHSHTQADAPIIVCHSAKRLKRGCCCAVATSRHTAFR